MLVGTWEENELDKKRKESKDIVSEVASEQNICIFKS
jgi:hypothetical protein